MSQLIPVRKARSGSDSFGNTWPEDDSVVKVPYEQALLLVKIPDGGFSIVEPDEGLPAREPQDQAEQAPVRIIEPRPAPDVVHALTEPARRDVEQGTAEPAPVEQLATEPTARNRRGKTAP